MNRETYEKLENYMLECMNDSAHDKEHIYRVLYSALDIASCEEDVDYDVLISACSTILQGRSKTKTPHFVMQRLVRRKHTNF